MWRSECQTTDKVTPPSCWAFRGVVRGTPVDKMMVDAIYGRGRGQLDEEQVEEDMSGREWFPVKDKWVLDQHQRKNGKKRKSESSLTFPSAKKHVPESIW